MYVRINQAKFPNKMAKQAVQKHAKTILNNFGEYGRMMRLTVDVSEISYAVITLWKDKETYKQFGFNYMRKFFFVLILLGFLGEPPSYRSFEGGL